MNPTTRGLIGLGTWMLAAILYRVVVTGAARRRSARTMWTGWGLLVAALWAVTLVRQLGDQWVRSLGLIYGALFALGMFGAPTAVALWIAIRRARAEIPDEPARDLLRVGAGYLGALLVTALLLPIPDIMALLGH